MKRIAFVYSDNDESFPLGPQFETREEAFHAGSIRFGAKWPVYTGLMMRVEAEDVVAVLSCPVDIELWADGLEFHESLADEILEMLRENEKRIQETIKKRLIHLLKVPCRKLACFEVREIERHEPGKKTQEKKTHKVQNITFDPTWMKD